VSRFILKRVLLALPILLGVSLVVFFTLKLIPGDPVASLLGPNSTPQARADLTARLGLDKPLPVQYVSWVSHVFVGDFGRSIARQTAALPLVWDAFQNTLILSGFAAVLAIVGGLVLGGIGALWRGRPPAAASNAFSLFAISTPQYSIALILIVYLAAKTGAFPAAGMRSPTGPHSLADLLRHLWLPGISAALVPMGIIARMFRSSMLDVLGQDFVSALRARGLYERRILVHAFHNALPSLLTIVGLQLGYLLGGVIFVETVFAWPGLGLLVYQSISQRDLPVIQAGVLVSAFAFVALNLVVDTLHGVIDPRIRQ
jgi:peptide/nickel transport system permease protein